MKSSTIAALLPALLATTVLAWDIRLDTQADTKFWQIQGTYLYANSLDSGGKFFPRGAASSAPQSINGVWYFKYLKHSSESFDGLDYKDPNVLGFVYRQMHSLVKSVAVQLLAHPSVAIFIQDNGGKRVHFWSSGHTWCVAQLQNYHSGTVHVGAQLNETGQYVLIDKIFIEAFTPPGNSSDFASLPPCRTEVRRDREALLESSEVPAGETDHSEIESFLIFPPSTSPRPTEASRRKNGGNSVHRPDSSSFVGRGETLTSMVSASSGGSLPDDVKCTCSCSCARKD